MTEENSDNNIPNEALNAFQSMKINDDNKSNNNNNNNDDINKITEKQKYDILLKPTGNAPIMKKKKWTVEGDKPISWIVDFMKKYMKLESHEKLFLYINQTFAPSPDQIVKNLYDCYSTEGKLVLHYCKTPAWG